MSEPPDTRDVFENQLRAWVRRGMTRRNIGVTEAAATVGIDQGYLSKWLLRSRGGETRGGISAWWAYRLASEFNIEPDQLFYAKPAAEFWRAYVPRKRAMDPKTASRESARPSRPTEAGAEKKAR